MDKMLYVGVHAKKKDKLNFNNEKKGGIMKKINQSSIVKGVLHGGSIVKTERTKKIVLFSKHTGQPCPCK